jgi:curved DNA-binding protein CbpA
MFKLIGEAYEVLSDAERRGIYDQWGRAGVAAHDTGAHPHTAAAPAPPSTRASRGGGAGFAEDFGFRHAQDIFEHFFSHGHGQGHDPFAGMHQHMYSRRGGFGGMPGAFAGFDAFFGGAGFDDTAAFFRGPGFGPSTATATASASASSSSSYTSSGGGSSRSVRRVVQVGLDGTRRIRTETTVTHADGRREVQVEECEEPQQQEPQLGPPASTPSLGQYQYQGQGQGQNQQQQQQQYQYQGQGQNQNQQWNG